MDEILSITNGMAFAIEQQGKAFEQLGCSMQPGIAGQEPVPLDANALRKFVTASETVDVLNDALGNAWSAYLESRRGRVR